MNSQEFRTAARTTFALAMDAYYAVSNDNDATMEQFIAADVAKTAADAQWIADQHTANTMAQAELDAATAKGCEEVVEATAKPITAMTPIEQVALSQARAAVENIRWDEINAAAIVAMNAHAPSANLVALRKYITTN